MNDNVRRVLKSAPCEQQKQATYQHWARTQIVTPMDTYTMHVGQHQTLAEVGRESSDKNEGMCIVRTDIGIDSIEWCLVALTTVILRMTCLFFSSF